MGKRDDSTPTSRGKQRKRKHDEGAPNGGEKQRPLKEKSNKSVAHKRAKHDEDACESRHKEKGNHKTGKHDKGTSDSGGKQHKERIDKHAHPSKEVSSKYANSMKKPDKNAGASRRHERGQSFQEGHAQTSKRKGETSTRDNEKHQIDEALDHGGRRQSSRERADTSTSHDDEKPDSILPNGGEASPIQEKHEKSTTISGAKYDDAVELDDEEHGKASKTKQVDECNIHEQRTHKKRSVHVASGLRNESDDSAISGDLVSSHSGGSSSSSSQSRSERGGHRGGRSRSRSRRRASLKAAAGFSAPIGLIPPPPAGLPPTGVPTAAARGANVPYGPAPDPNSTGTLALLPEKVRGLLDNQETLAQDVVKLKKVLEANRIPAPVAKSLREEGKETVLRMPPRLHESLLHPDNEPRLIALTGLASCSLNEDGLVVLRAHSRRGLAKALGQLRRIAFHCQWGCSKAKVGALLTGRPARPLNAMLVRLAATSSRLQSHEARLTHKAPKLRIGTQTGACQFLVEGIPGLSRKHCTITFEPDKGACYLQDLSTNGTYLNGKRLPRPPYKNPQDARVRLFHGDELFFRLKSEETEELGFVVNLMPLS